MLCECWQQKSGKSCTLKSGKYTPAQAPWQGSQVTEQRSQQVHTNLRSLSLRLDVALQVHITSSQKILDLNSLDDASHAEPISQASNCCTRWGCGCLCLLLLLWSFLLLRSLLLLRSFLLSWLLLGSLLLLLWWTRSSFIIWLPFPTSQNRDESVWKLHKSQQVYNVIS